MRYRILLIILFLSALSGQSLFNRWVGSDPFMGSPRSTAMGNTHLLNSTGSSNVRFNPANLGNMKTKRGFDFQLNRFSKDGACLLGIVLESFSPMLIM